MEILNKRRKEEETALLSHCEVFSSFTGILLSYETATTSWKSNTSNADNGICKNNQVFRIYWSHSAQMDRSFCKNAYLMVLRTSFQVKHKVLFILWCEQKYAIPIWWGCWEVRRQLVLTPQHYTAACMVSRAHLQPDMCRDQQGEVKWEWTGVSAVDVTLQYICPDATLYTKEPPLTTNPHSREIRTLPVEENHH